MHHTRKGQFIVTSSRQIYKNPWIEVTEDSVIRPGGEKGIFGTLDMRDGVAILPLFDDGSVLLAREYKYAQEKEMIEIVGGGIDDGESPENAAARELAEEAGLEADELIRLGVADPFTTLVRTRDYLVIATGLRELRERPPADDVVEPFRISLATAVDYVMDGTITHAVSCLLILRAALAFPHHVKGRTLSSR
ncbi:NUDIX hydrolase [Vreelandella sp. TE19]